MRTREFVVQAGARAVPAVLWTPEGPRRKRPVVLVGHGGSQHKTHPGVVELAGRFVTNLGFAVAAIDGPVHGARRAAPLSGADMQAEFLALWTHDGRIDAMVEDWRCTLDRLCAMDEVDPSTVGWYGVSMGTAYGLPLIATEPRIRAAVLGMWGGDFVNSERLRIAAGSVECPVMFQQKWNDQLFTREGQLGLFDLLKTERKWLKIYPGAHVPVAGEQADDAEAFLAGQLSGLAERAAPVGVTGQRANARKQDEDPPLRGVRVLDLSRALAGPFCTMILGDLGAEVFKVEPTPNGDFIRSWGPFDRDESAYFLSTNRNKRSIALDFRRPESRDLLREWALECDVLVENFKPGTAEAMGLDYPSLAALNRNLVYASISGFGSEGPLSHLPGFDQIAQGYSGLMSLTGTPESGPVRVGVAIGDLTAGMWCAMGVLAALRVRDATGIGQKVETSLLGSLVGLLSVQGQRYLSLKQIPRPTGNEHPVIAPYGTFRAADGEFTLAPATPDMWIALCRILGLGFLVSDPRFEDNAGRVKHRGDLKALIERKLHEASRESWIARFTEAGIPAGPIHALDEALNSPQVRASGMVETVDHPTLGALELLANPIRMASLPNRENHAPPPMLGQHTIEVLQNLGYSPDRIETLLQQGIVVQRQM